MITRGRAGTVIAPPDGVTQRLEQGAREYVALADRLGIERDRAAKAVAAALETAPPA